MGENRIYFAVGFKSYNIKRLVAREEVWFEWVERSRNLMRRTTFNKKTMEWIVLISKWQSKEASESMVRRNNEGIDIVGGDGAG
ncbi:unnamed protein product [Withania somnifera]